MHAKLSESVAEEAMNDIITFMESDFMRPD